MTSDFSFEGQSEDDKGRSLSSPEGEEKDFLNRFSDWYGRARENKEPVKKMMENSYMAYRGIMSDFAMSQRDVLRWGLAVFVPYTFQTCASIETQLLGRPPGYRLGAMRSPKDRQAAQFIEKISHAEFRRANVQRVVAQNTHISLIFGTAFYRTHFKFDKKTRKFLKNVEETLDGKKPIYEEKDHTFYKGVSVESIHPLKVYLPPVHEHDPQRWPYLIERDMVDVRKLKEFYDSHPELAYKDNYKFIKAGGDSRDDMEVYFKQDVLYRLPLTRYPGSRRDLVSATSPQTVNLVQQDTKHLVEVFRVYSNDSDEWAVIAHGRVVEYHPNPIEDTKEMPIVVARDYQVANSPWGIGEPEVIRWLQFEANALHNLGLDSTKYSVAPIFAMNSAYLDDEDEFEIVPGKIIHLKNIPGVTVDSAIKALNMPEVKGSIFRMLEENKTITRETTGIGSSVVGGNEPGEGSATESNNLKQAASARIYDRARRIEQENLVDLVKQQISFMAQYYDEDMVVKVSDDEFFKFIPGEAKEAKAADVVQAQVDGYAGVIYGEDLALGYDVYVEGESTLPISRQERRTEGMQLLKIASDVRRPPTAEELASDPNLPQKYPQGLPVLDADSIARNILLPTFTTVDRADEYIWSLDGQGPDRTRPPGRPADAFNAAASVGNPMVQPPLGGTMTQAQPLNQNINSTEAAGVLPPPAPVAQ